MDSDLAKQATYLWHRLSFHLHECNEEQAVSMISRAMREHADERIADMTRDRDHWKERSRLYEQGVGLVSEKAKRLGEMSALHAAMRVVDELTREKQRSNDLRVALQTLHTRVGAPSVIDGKKTCAICCGRDSHKRKCAYAAAERLLKKTREEKEGL